MPKKCESCRFFTCHETVIGKIAKCTSNEVLSRVDVDFVYLNKFVEFEPAREICNKEGDGIFVYYEPKTPTAGAAAVAGEGGNTTGRECASAAVGA